MIQLSSHFKGMSNENILHDESILCSNVFCGFTWVLKICRCKFLVILF